MLINSIKSEALVYVLAVVHPSHTSEISIVSMIMFDVNTMGFRIYASKTYFSSTA